MDQREPSANYGPCVDIFAPGDHVDSLSSQGTHYTDFGLTSAAAPYVAGAVARHLSEYGTPQDPATIEDRLKSLATPNVVDDAQTSPNLLLFTFYERWCFIEN